MRPDIVPGARFPDYEIVDQTNTPRRLSELQGRDPMVLILSRGMFCPKDHQQHQDLAEFQNKLNPAISYTKTVTISTDAVYESNEFRLQVGARWPFLSDPERTVQKDLEIKEYTDPNHDPMIPHTLVLKPGLVIYKVYNGYFFWGRPSNEDLWRDLREIFRKLPDWDITAPGLRENWEEGDQSMHYPYEEDPNYPYETNA